MTVQETNIVWTDYSGNHWVGCAKTSEGCRNCWAAGMADRFDRTPEPWTIEHAEENLQVYDECFVEQLASVGPGWVFTPSSSDPCLPWLPEEARQKWYSAIVQNDQHCYQVLTKWGAEDRGLQMPDFPDHVMVGVSCESPRRRYRIDWLREQTAGMKFVSFEPLVEPIPEVDLTGIDWIIVGGESKRAADERREMDPEWARDLLRAAREQDVAMLFKQHSGPYPEHSRALAIERQAPGGGTITETREFNEFPETPDGVPDAPAEFLGGGDR